VHVAESSGAGLCPVLGLRAALVFLDGMAGGICGTPVVSCN